MMLDGPKTNHSMLLLFQMMMTTITMMMSARSSGMLINVVDVVTDKMRFQRRSVRIMWVLFVSFRIFLLPRAHGSFFFLK